MDKSSIAKFIAERWVSWLMELAVLSVVAYFTISETHKTAEQTREMLAKYDAAISQYAAQKTEAVDSAVSQAYEAAREKAKSISPDNVRNLLKRKNDDEDEQ